jgi:hypothetical protein
VRIISEEDFKGWWANPVGQEVRAMLMERVSKINDQALNQDMIRDTVHCAVFLGRKLEIQDFLNMSYQELMGEE